MSATDPTAGECSCDIADRFVPGCAVHAPAEPDAGDMEPSAVRRIVGAWDCCGTCAGGVLASLLRKAGDERAEQIAQAIEALDGPMTGENPTSAYLAIAARIARSAR